MKRNNLILLSVERAKRNPNYETPLQKAGRILVGVLVIIAAFALMYGCEQRAQEQRQTSFQNCLWTGMAPMNCSIEIAFTEKY